MKILEINGFMTWAVNYEGDHEVVRWKPTARLRRDGEPSSGLGVLRRGFKLLREVKSMELDLILCGAFGRAYSKGLLHRVVKACGEVILIRLIGAIKRKSGVPLAVVDIADDHTIHPVNRGLLKIADRYFKRELPLDPYHALESMRHFWARQGTLRDRRLAYKRGWVQKLQPVSLGCREVEPLDKLLVAKEKHWDVFYVGNDEFKPRRADVDEAIHELADRGYSTYMPTEKLSIDDYLQAMSGSRLAISPPGLGWDCHRHYEAAMLGTVGVTAFPTIKRHTPLRNGEHCFFYDSEKKLADQLEGLLKDDLLLEKIAKAAQEYAGFNHTHEAIFESVVKRACSNTPV